MKLPICQWLSQMLAALVTGYAVGLYRADSEFRPGVSAKRYLSWQCNVHDQLQLEGVQR
ncbi:MAG: hypothetical protein ABJ056_14220 [Halioglobus sp.]